MPWPVPDDFDLAGFLRASKAITVLLGRRSPTCERGGALRSHL